MTALRQNLAYGLLGAPLAMAALPIYIHTPKLYGDELGLGLTLTGLILLLSRSVDTLQDPWLGRLSDIAQRHAKGWLWLLGIAALSLMAAYTALFNPPLNAGGWLGVWFAVCLVLVYTAHSALNITYLTWGALASDRSARRTRLVAYREAFALVGVILASVLPMVLVQTYGLSQGWLLFSLVFALFLIPSLFVLLRYAPAPRRASGRDRVGLLQPLASRPFRRLLLLFLLNGLAMAIAATLSLFYIADVLQLEQVSGYLLAIYFISGAASLPLWVWLAARIGRTLTWIIGSFVSIIGFFWAVQLGAGDLLPYAMICFMSGAALGADLAMPAAIAADLVPHGEEANSASYFGIWSFINKLVLALAAGFSLPLLAGFGYIPGKQEGIFALALLYAGTPCLIKLFSTLLLIRWRQSLEVSYVD